METMIEGTSRSTWRPGSCEQGDVLGGHDRVSLEMYLEAEIKLNSEIHLEAMIERVWSSTGRL
jgi:hypothetical protein